MTALFCIHSQNYWEFDLCEHCGCGLAVNCYIICGNFKNGEKLSPRKVLEGCCYTHSVTSNQPRVICIGACTNTHSKPSIMSLELRQNKIGEVLNQIHQSQTPCQQIACLSDFHALNGWTSRSLNAFQLGFSSFLSL